MAMAVMVAGSVDIGVPFRAVLEPLMPEAGA
jgi:hypothetical protein